MISQREIDIIIEVMKPYNPKKIGIFGSYARGENTEESDIDILYEDRGKTTLFDHITMIESLKKHLNRDVDLVTSKALHPMLENKILNDIKVIYEC